MENHKHPVQAYTSFIAAEILLLIGIFTIEWTVALVLFKTYLTIILFVVMAVGLFVSRDRVFEESASDKYLDIRRGMRGVIYAAAWPNRLVTGQMSRSEAVSALGLFAVTLFFFLL